MKNNTHNTISDRSKISLIMFLTFFILIPSGIIMHLYDSPLLNHKKHAAMIVHNISAIIFVLSGIFHIKYNFRSVKKYLLEIIHNPFNIRNDSW